MRGRATVIRPVDGLPAEFRIVGEYRLQNPAAVWHVSGTVVLDQQPDAFALFRDEVVFILTPQQL
jgi:hypothetical protein